MNQEQPLIARNITVRYDEKVVVDDISIDIDNAECLGLLGANGSGKTTIARACTGDVPQRQNVLLAGYNPFDSPARIRHYSRMMKDDANLPEWATPRQIIQFASAVDKSFDVSYAKTMGDHNIDLDKRVKTMSRGMRVLANAILVFASRVRLLLLDEPTLGLDGYYRDSFFERVQDRFSEPDPPGMLLCTHDVLELERCMSSVLVLVSGKQFVSCSSDELKRDYAAVITPDKSERSIPGALGWHPWEGGRRYLVKAAADSPERSQLESYATESSLTIKPASIHLAYQVACSRQQPVNSAN